MKIRKGINMRLGNYKLTSDSLCYTLERVGINNDKESKNYGAETLSFVGYLTSFPSVMYAMLEDGIRGCGAETAEKLRNENLRIEKELRGIAKNISVYRACWCKDCRHLGEGCLNPRSINYMDAVGEYNSCEHCERKVAGNE